MCGRYATTRSQIDLATLFEATDESVERLVPDYNVAPTDPVPIVRSTTAGRVLSVARWGLLPHWARDARTAARMINARAETVATSSAFAPSFAQRRCLVPADGWYEWLKLPDRGRQAYFMTTVNGAVLAFAGMWTRWQDRLTCAIVTTAAVGDLAKVHDRMPLLLPPDRWARWLRESADPEHLLAPPPDAYVAALEIRPVGPAVGDVRNDGPSLIARDSAIPTLF
jgi:putative SOS response-associated peptidase YedK